MNFKEYRGLASRTRRASLPHREHLANAGLGLAGESGEAADIVKKHLFQGHDLDRDKMRIELGDVLWYLDYLAAECGLTLEEVALANIAKLKARYPEGFDESRSRDRGEP